MKGHFQTVRRSERPTPFIGTKSLLCVRQNLYWEARSMLIQNMLVFAFAVVATQHSILLIKLDKWYVTLVQRGGPCNSTWRVLSWSRSTASGSGISISIYVLWLTIQYTQSSRQWQRWWLDPRTSRWSLRLGLCDSSLRSPPRLSSSRPSRLRGLAVGEL